MAYFLSFSPCPFLLYLSPLRCAAGTESAHYSHPCACPTSLENGRTRNSVVKFLGEKGGVFVREPPGGRRTTRGPCSVCRRGVW